MNKIDKNKWEKVFLYPSFNIRFWSTLILGFLFFLILGLGFFNKHKDYLNISEQLTFWGLVVQLAILFLGIFTAYYALRQLSESRFTKLDEAGIQNFRNGRYFRAIYNWKEAFYVRPDTNIFLNLAETYLLIKDYEFFDEHVNNSEIRFLKNKVFKEKTDKIILLYLKVVRNLLVKNQGKAESFILDILSLMSEVNEKRILEWDFFDIIKSKPYKELNGECKIMINNISNYLSGNMTKEKRNEFEDGNFSIQ
ncbi:MAG: hypothetical protein WD607_00805 [Candidatus Paceibacterota bacterium]